MLAETAVPLRARNKRSNDNFPSAETRKLFGFLGFYFFGELQVLHLSKVTSPLHARCTCSNLAAALIAQRIGNRLRTSKNSGKADGPEENCLTKRKHYAAARSAMGTCSGEGGR
jgi:hypothetical protein